MSTRTVLQKPFIPLLYFSIWKHKVKEYYLTININRNISINRYLLLAARKRLNWSEYNLEEHKILFIPKNARFPKDKCLFLHRHRHQKMTQTYKIFLPWKRAELLWIRIPYSIKFKANKNEDNCKCNNIIIIEADMNICNRFYTWKFRILLQIF